MSVIDALSEDIAFIGFQYANKKEVKDYQLKDNPNMTLFSLFYISKNCLVYDQKSGKYF